MTDTEKFTHLLKVLKSYAEQPTCYNLNPDYEYPHHNWDIFEDGSDYGEIMFARTLLECIEVDYDYPWSDGKMSDLKFTSPSGETTIKVQDTGRLGTIAPKTQLHIKMDEPVQYETPMTENEEEIEKVKAEIKVLEKKLSFLEELEKTKSPVEEAYRRWWGEYPSDDNGWEIDNTRWRGFRVGYNYAQKDYKVGEYQEPAKDVVSLYERFVNEGAYGMTSFENVLRVVNDFLLDEGVIEDESGEYITFTLQKSLLEVPND